MNSPAPAQEKVYYVPEPAIVSRVTVLTETEKRFTLRLNDGSLSFAPGQFIQVSVFGYGEAPFSLCSSPLDSDVFDVCVRGVGKCCHCQLNDVYVCQDGPVFSYSDLTDRTEALEAWAPEGE